MDYYSKTPTPFPDVTENNRYFFFFLDQLRRIIAAIRQNTKISKDKFSGVYDSCTSKRSLGYVLLREVNRFLR